MNNRTFQGRFRPLVNRAWEAQARLKGLRLSDKSARDTWYRSALEQIIHRPTTANATEAEQKTLLHTFAAIAEADHDIPVIHGWTEAQNQAFEELVLSAWAKHGDAPEKTFRAWLKAECAEAGLFSWSAGVAKRGRTETFDSVMSHFAILADNTYWLNRTAVQAEIRLRYGIRQKLRDMDELTGEEHHWSYVRSIWSQSELLPADILDAPASLLHKVMCMLDTHVRRLADRLGQDFRLLPSRMEDGKHPPLL